MSSVDPTASHDAPTCPRHPGVVSYVRCARCERPTCPACQRPAAVGIQCVDCVRQAARTSQGARTSLGAPARFAQGSPGTMVLVGLCLLVFLAQKVVPGLENDLAFAPFIGRDEPWRFVTAAFLHGGVSHILFNMLALWTVGQPLERAMGTARFVAVYLISAIGGSVGYLLLASPSALPTAASSSWFTPTVGASGAVFGLFAVELVLARVQGLDIRPMLGFLGINLVIGFMVPNIAWQAHLGGFVTGAVLAGIVWATRGRGRRQLQWPGMIAVLAVLVVLAVVKYASAPALGGWVG